MKKYTLIYILMLILSIDAMAISGEEVFNNYANVYSKLRGIAEVKFLDPDGKTTGSRLAEQWAGEENGLKRRALTLHKPENARGTRFLSVENAGGDTDTWVYSPDLKSVRRLVQADKSKGFLGSPDGTLTNEDMETVVVKDYNIKMLADETYEGEECYVLEASKKDKDKSQYGKKVMWIVKEKWVPVKQEYYNKSGKKIKYELRKNLKKMGDTWSFEILESKNLESGFSIQYKVLKSIFGEAAKIEPERFSQRYLTTGEIK